MTFTEGDPKEVARQYVEVAWNDGNVYARDGILTDHQGFPGGALRRGGGSTLRRWLLARDRSNGESALFVASTANACNGTAPFRQ